MQTNNQIIISFVGSVGAGKSTIIKSFLNLLTSKGISFNFFGIDETRKGIWEQRAKAQWTWEDEDDAYAEIFSKISNLKNSLVILETTGLARRMQRAHRLLAQTSTLLTVKISCDPETCAMRHATRDKDMNEYPPLPLQNTIEEGIFLMADDLQMLSADLTLDSFKNEIETNTTKLWTWFQALKKEKKIEQKPKDYISNYVLDQQKIAKSQNISLAFESDLIEIAKLIATQSKNSQVLVLARDLFLNPGSKKLELEVFNTYEDQLQQILNNCFETNLRIIRRRKTSFILRTSQNEEIRINCAAREPFLGGQSYASPEHYAEEADFTVNTIYIDPLTNKLVDPLNAIDDLKNLELKSPDITRYKKHPKTLIDIYQAIQLTGRFGFKLDPTLKAYYQSAINVGSLLSISAFFTADELTQLFNQPRFTSLGFELMRELGILELDFPEIYELYRQEAFGKKALWTTMLRRLDQLKERNYSLYLACMLSDIGTSIEQVEQILGVFQMGERIIANVNICLIQKQKLFELKQLAENIKPIAKPVKTQLRFQPKPSNTTDDLREPAQKFFASFWPLTIAEFYIYLEQTEAKKFRELKEFTENLIKRYKIDPEFRANLVTKKMLVDRFKNIKGETISILLAEVDKQRLRLLTPERAINYLEENFPRLIN